MKQHRNKILKNNLLPRLLLANVVLFFTGACISMREPSPPVPKRDCYCGLITITAAQPQKTCALWYKDWNKRIPQMVLASSSNSTCTVQQCQKDFAKAKTCKSVEPWMETVTTPAVADAPCYCDWVPLPNDPRGSSACAIWKPGDQFLLEYHFTQRCDFLTCQSSPFRTSKALCPKGFRTFYE